MQSRGGWLVEMIDVLTASLEARGGIDKARWKEELLGWEAEESRLVAGREREKKIGEAGWKERRGRRGKEIGAAWQGDSEGRIDGPGNWKRA